MVMDLNIIINTEMTYAEAVVRWILMMMKLEKTCLKI